MRVRVLSWRSPASAPTRWARASYDPGGDLGRVGTGTDGRLQAVHLGAGVGDPGLDRFGGGIAATVLLRRHHLADGFRQTAGREDAMTRRRSSRPPSME
jgi:hypothetical protein